MTLTEIFKAQKLNKYYAGVKGEKLVEAMFPANFTNDFSFNVLQGLSNGAVEVLQTSEYDANPLARDWGIKTVSKEDKEFFRERMVFNEKQRRELLEIVNLKDETLKQKYVEQLYSDIAGEKGFLASVRALATYTAAQFLSSGKVTYLTGNGEGRTIDYKLENKYKETLAGTQVWSAATAKPIEDLQRWREVLLEEGKTVDIALMNEKTYNLIKNHQSVREIVERQKIYPTPANIKSTIEDLTELKILVWKDTVSIKGVAKKAFPDNIVTLIPNGQLGNMEYGPTPTRTDKVFGLDEGRDICDIDGSYATLEVEPVKKASTVRNIEVVIESLVAPNPTIINAMFIANVV